MCIYVEIVVDMITINITMSSSFVTIVIIISIVSFLTLLYDLYEMIRYLIRLYVDLYVYVVYTL